MKEKKAFQNHQTEPSEGMKSQESRGTKRLYTKGLEPFQEKVKDYILHSQVVLKIKNNVIVWLVLVWGNADTLY